MSFSSIPQYQLSKIDNILTVGFIKSKDIRDFGQSSCLRRLIEIIKSLEEEGILLNIEGKEFKVHFLLALVLGDNLGLNHVLCYSTSFNSNSFCRICRRQKQNTQKDHSQIENSIRNRDNYSEDLKTNETKLTGIKENSIFNTIGSFHVTQNIIFDLMHDIFNGICRYNLSKIINYFVYEKKNLSLETLNYRKQMFNYGVTEIGNISPTIEKHHIQNGNFKMTSSEMKTFVHFILLMIGDLINDNDRVYKFLLEFIEIIDIVLLSEFNEFILKKLEILISNHNTQYVKLFNENLKPKHHFLVHYAFAIRMSGPLRNLWSFRFESYHQKHKKYSRNMNSRVNIPFTLTLKSNLEFANNILNEAFFMKEISFKNLLNINIEEKSYFQKLKKKIGNVNIMKLLQEVEGFCFRGLQFKKEFILTQSQNLNQNCTPFPKVFEIIDVLYDSNKKNFLILSWEWKLKKYLNHYRCYEVDKIIDFCILQAEALNKIDGPPVHFYYLCTGEKVLRIKHYF